MADGIPPWLQIDPVAPVGRLLEGYRAGLAAGEGQRDAALRAQQMAIAQAQAAEMAQYRQAQMQQEAAQFNAKLRLDQQKAEREAQRAAMQFGAQQKIQRAIAGGMEPVKAVAQFATELFADDPRGLSAFIQSQAPPQFGFTAEGIPYGVTRSGGLSFPPVGYGRQGFVPQIRTFGEGADAVRLYERTPGQWYPVREEQEGRLHQDAMKELQRINSRDAAIHRELKGLTREEAALSPSDAALYAELDRNEATRNAINSRTWVPGEPTPQPAAPTPDILPLPRTKAELIKGKTYQTRRGVATWDGEKFVQ